MESEVIKCEICGTEMRTRVNGSHLKRAHNITLADYVSRYPNAPIGKRTPKLPTYKCQICDTDVIGSQSLSKHLRIFHNLSLESYYIDYHCNGIVPTCKCGCGNDAPFHNMEKGFRTYIHNHGTTFAENNEEYKKRKTFISWNTGLTMETDDRVRENGQKIKAAWNPTNLKARTEGYQKTMMERYGVINGFQDEAIKEKSKNTLLAKYGYDNPNKSPAIKKKTKSTKLDRYGDENYVNPEKNKSTCMTRYGVTNVNKLDSVREKISDTQGERYGGMGWGSPTIGRKIKDTNLQRYGTEIPMHNEELFIKQKVACFKMKDYTLPSGRIVKVQGYEPFALNMLMSHYGEADVVVSRRDLPKFFYTIDGKLHKYYPDVYVKSTNTIVEVKSMWTSTKNVEVDKLKMESVINNGCNFRRLIFNGKGELIDDTTKNSFTNV
jgi:hypothetical protein